MRLIPPIFRKRSKTIAGEVPLALPPAEVALLAAILAVIKFIRAIKPKLEYQT